jgi:hypothetical protein
MKPNLYYFVALLIILSMMGCATTVPKTPQQIINDAKVQVAISYKQARERFENNISTKQEFSDEIKKIDGYKAKVNESQKLLDQGFAVLARDKAALVNQLVITLQRELAQRARRSP